MLAVPYFEKALYELPEEQLTVEALVQLADRIEADLQGGLSPRPLLSVREGEGGRGETGVCAAAEGPTRRPVTTTTALSEHRVWEISVD